jgi:hypothetical protein
MTKAKKTKNIIEECVSEDSYQRYLSKMQKKLDQSYNRLKKDFARKANLNTLRKDSHELMMLLGEANFLEKECKKLRKAI